MLVKWTINRIVHYFTAVLDNRMLIDSCLFAVASTTAPGLEILILEHRHRCCNANKLRTRFRERMMFVQFVNVI